MAGAHGLRFLAGQFARPHGWIGRWLVGPYLDHLSRGMNATALAALDIGRGERVLEVGFGGGALIEFILSIPCAEVVGVDVSRAMVAPARRRFRREIARGRARLIEGLAESLPLGDCGIDKACSVNTLYFWRDPPAALAELARVIRPGGRLVLCFQSAAQVRRWPGHRFGFTAYPTDAVASWMRQAGFAMVEVRSSVDPSLGDFHCLSGVRDGAKAES